VCDSTETCSGGNDCPADTFATATPCRAAAGDCDAVETCSGASAECPADLPKDNGSSCNDGSFCNGADTCVAGACTSHAGDPCPGADGDADCSEACDEAADACTANDPNGSACNDGNACTTGDSCSAGTCSGTPDPQCVTTTTAEPIPLCGDANHDGKVKAGDALQVLQFSVGLGTCDLDVCDYNGSGKVTAGDALEVLRDAVGLPTDPNCPLPSADVPTTVIDVTSTTIASQATTTVP
jgi:hypothetical protein